MFQQNPGVGTCDGTYGNKKDFKCASGCEFLVECDDFVTVLEDLEDDYYSELTTLSKSPKRDDHGLFYEMKSLLGSIIPPIFKGKFPEPRNFDALKINQRVVIFHDEGIPLRGTVRYTGVVEDSSEHVKSVVGLELVGNPQSHAWIHL